MPGGVPEASGLSGVFDTQELVVAVPVPVVGRGPATRKECQGIGAVTRRCARALRPGAGVSLGRVCVGYRSWDEAEAHFRALEALACALQNLGL